MKKLGLFLGLVAFSAGWLQAANCSGTMTLATLSAGALPGGCDFNGFNFNNFELSNYIASPNFSGGPQYDGFSGTPAQNLPKLGNYLVNFAALAGGGVSVTFSGAVVQTDGKPAWTVQTTSTAFANFAFEIKYNIGNGTDANPGNNKSVNNLQTLAATLGGVVYTGPGAAPNTEASATFGKVSQVNGGLQSVTDDINFASGSQTKTLNLSANATGTMAITDNLSLVLFNDPNAELRVTSLGNAFDFNSPVPEPMTTGLMGLGLASLAFIRRRQQR